MLLKTLVVFLELTQKFTIITKNKLTIKMAKESKQQFHQPLAQTHSQED